MKKVTRYIESLVVIQESFNMYSGRKRYARGSNLFLLHIAIKAVPGVVFQMHFSSNNVNQCFVACQAVNAISPKTPG